MREDTTIEMTLEEFWNLPIDKSIYNIKIQYKGHTFVAGVYKSSRDKSIWTDKGETMCYGFDTYSTLEDVKCALDIYVNDKYMCARCGKIIDKHNYKLYERISAGIYCKDCWTYEDELERDLISRD